VVQEGVGTDEQTEGTSDSRGGFPAGQVNQFIKSIEQADRLSGVSRGDGGQRFSEDTPRALRVIAEELANAHLDADRVSLPG